MSIQNTKVNIARQVLTTRLGFIISRKLDKGVTQKELAEQYGVGPNAISALKNRRWNKISLSYMLKVGDAMGLEYALTIQNKAGEKSVLIQLPSYDNDPLIKLGDRAFNAA